MTDITPSSHPFPPSDPGPSELLPLPGGGHGAPDEATAVGTLPAEQPEPDAELPVDAALWAVVLAGGIGSRFWPLSSPERPKQCLSLVNDRPLIADAVARLAPLIPAERVLVLTSLDIADALRAAVPELPEANMLVEPRPLGTAAALAWGAQEVARRAGRKTVFCAMHADLAVGYPDEFRRTLRRAAAVAASDDSLVVLGARPTRPETGFGYVLPVVPLGAGEGPGTGTARPVARFVEKPRELLAEALIGEGALWHTGICIWQAGTVLDALAVHTPELQAGLPALAAGQLDRFAGLIQSISIDRGLLERSDRVVVITADFAWDDVGTWACLRRVRELDDTGNGVLGDAHLVDASSNIVHAESSTVVVYGVSQMLVVSLPGLTFVTSLDRARELNPLLDTLPAELKHGVRGERA